MMKTQNKKRGFTIIELVIVVTVIAILSAVLIPTFAGIIKKANRSADEQAVASMNTALVAANDDVDTVAEVIDYLAGEGYAVGTYAPLSKGYSFVYSASLNKVLLYSETDKAIVFPKEYANCDDAVTLVTDEGETAVEATDKASYENGGIIAVNSDFASAAEDKYLKIKNDLVVNLNATISNENNTASGGAFTVWAGASLTINGNGTVNGKATAENDYNIAVWAFGGDVVINGGNYTNEGAKAVDAKGNANNNELIYATNGGKITINGGTFKSANPQYTLNCKDGAGCSIIVKGGKFYKYSPAADANDASIIIPEGYKVVQNGDWYEVVKA